METFPLFTYTEDKEKGESRITHSHQQSDNLVDGEEVEKREGENI